MAKLGQQHYGASRLAEESGSRLPQSMEQSVSLRLARTDSQLVNKRCCLAKSKGVSDGALIRYPVNPGIGSP